MYDLKTFRIYYLCHKNVIEIPYPCLQEKIMCNVLSILEKSFIRILETNRNIALLGLTICSTFP